MFDNKFKGQELWTSTHALSAGDVTLRFSRGACALHDATKNRHFKETAYVVNRVHLNTTNRNYAHVARNMKFEYVTRRIFIYAIKHANSKCIDNFQHGPAKVGTVCRRNMKHENKKIEQFKLVGQTLVASFFLWKCTWLKDVRHVTGGTRGRARWTVATNKRTIRD